MYVCIYVSIYYLIKTCPLGHWHTLESRIIGGVGINGRGWALK